MFQYLKIITKRQKEVLRIIYDSLINAGFPPSFSELKEKLKICSKERQEYLDGWQRERASFANFKTEQEKIKSNFLNIFII